MNFTARRRFYIRTGSNPTAAILLNRKWFFISFKMFWDVIFDVYGNYEEQIVPGKHCYYFIKTIWIIYEPPLGKTNNLHRRKQRRRSASR